MMKPSGSAVAAPKPVTPDLTKRNIDLGFDLLDAILDDSSILDQIPHGITLILLPSGDPELFASNVELGLNAIHRGRDVLFRHVRPATSEDATGP